jgi:hypothetical protein
MARDKVWEYGDGIQISDRPVWEHRLGELLMILLKRIVALPAKLIGFRPFCLLLATWLLERGRIQDWMWFGVLIVILFGMTGLRTVLRRGNDIYGSGYGNGGDSGGYDGKRRNDESGGGE